MDLAIGSNLVIVCGPVATGKTTLAERIMDECPRHNKTLIPFDRYTEVVDEAVGTAVVTSGKGISFMHNVKAACKDNGFVVCDGCYLDYGNLSSFLGRLKVLRVEALPVTLIKMFPKRELRRQYALARPEGAPSMVLEKQQNEVFAEVVKTEFHKLFPWVEPEYTILDPSNVNIKFL